VLSRVETAASNSVLLMCIFTCSIAACRRLVGHVSDGQDATLTNHFYRWMFKLMICRCATEDKTVINVVCPGASGVASWGVQLRQCPGCPLAVRVHFGSMDRVHGSEVDPHSQGASRTLTQIWQYPLTSAALHRILVVCGYELKHTSANLDPLVIKRGYPPAHIQVHFHKCMVCVTGTRII